jgi:ABC-type transport system involved in cytochrome c biogenesis permease subunit
MLRVLLMESFILTAVAIAALSLTITRSTITTPVRAFALDHMPWAVQLLGCPYCMSHWLAFAAAWFVDVQLVANPVVNFVAVVFALVGVAAVVSGLIFKLVLHQEAEIERLRDALVRLKGQLK